MLSKNVKQILFTQPQKINEKSPLIVRDKVIWLIRECCIAGKQMNNELAARS